MSSSCRQEMLSLPSCSQMGITADNRMGAIEWENQWVKVTQQTFDDALTVAQVQWKEEPARTWPLDRC
jgi:hypothetical protein